MTSSVQQAVRYAWNLFSRLSTPSFSNEKLLNLAGLVSEIKGKDVNLDEETVTRLTSMSSAPVTYVHIWEDDVMSVGIFLLKSGASIPLHDHPNMYGICKVIHGKMTVESHSRVKDKSQDIQPPKLIQERIKSWQDVCLPVKSQGREILSQDDKCCILTPDDGNFHEIRSQDGPAAFFDILAPPYDHDACTRVCQYYRLFKQDQQVDGAHPESSSRADVSWLVPVPQPSEFFCDTANYKGPEIDLS